MSEDPQKLKQMSVSSPGPKVSIISVACRICYDNEKDEELINPCRCKVSCYIQNKHISYY